MLVINGLMFFMIVYRTPHHQMTVVGGFTKIAFLQTKFLVLLIAFAIKVMN